MKNTQTHFTYQKENEGRVDFYVLAPHVGICFNEIYTNSWTKGDSSLFSEQMLILNFCINGRCDVSLSGNRYAIVGERQICISTIRPTKDFYYPGCLYEGIQIYIDMSGLNTSDSPTDLPDIKPLGTSLTEDTASVPKDFLTFLGIHPEQIVEIFCGNDSLYLHRMNDTIYELVQDIWKTKEEPYLGILRYLAVRLLHELMNMPGESEVNTYFTRSQIAIVKDAEALIMQDLSRRITAKEMADRFGISESSFKLYIKGILGDSYLSYFRKKRMERAAELLESTNMKVIEIANAVGYENQGKFAKVFAEIYGVLPLEFRRLSK